jgi:hypothetical protein
MSKFPVIRAKVWCIDRCIDMPFEIRQSIKGYFIIVSKFSGLSPKMKAPKSGFTTIWLRGNLREGFHIPKGSFKTI